MAAVIGCGLAAIAATASAESLHGGFPSPFEVAFDVNTNGVTVAETLWSLKALANGGFVYESRSETRGVLSIVRTDSIVERSEGHIIGDLLRPAAYFYDRNRGKRRRQVSVTFDWSSGTAANSVSDQTWEMAIPEGTLDKLSYLLMMIRDLRRGHRELSYSIADGGKLKTYALDVISQVEVETALGKFSALKVKRRRVSTKRETVFLCAEELGFFPVKITHRATDGKTLELTITRAHGI